MGEYAVRAAPRDGVGEIGMEAAVRTMMRHGIAAEVQKASVAFAVGKGASGALDLLASVGCVVTDADRAECTAFVEYGDEF